MKIRYERTVKQICEIELSEDEFKNEFESDVDNVLDWGEETGDFEVVSEQYPEFAVAEIKYNPKGISFKNKNQDFYKDLAFKDIVVVSPTGIEYRLTKDELVWYLKTSKDTIDFHKKLKHRCYC